MRYVLLRNLWYRLPKWLLVALFLLLTGPALAQPRTALVIGNGAYDEAPLRNPTNDARDMAAKLRDLDFLVIETRNADRAAMRRALRDFQGQLRQRGGVGLFYYAGHGVQVNGRNYLIPVDADIRREYEVPDQALNADSVLRAMESADNKLNIVILDACRNNPYARRFRSASRGLARMAGPSGILIAYATRPGSISRDGDERNSPFTKHLLTYMDNPGLTVEQVFKRVLVKVEQDTGGEQSPWMEGALRGDFYFTPAGPPPRPGQVFWDTLSDGTRGPEMIVIPAGEFWMGSPESEAGRDDDEKRHRVVIDRAYALSKHEVTVREFQRFVDATGYRTDAERNAGGKEGCWAFDRDDPEKHWNWRNWANWKKPNKYQANQGGHPVACVSWNDALVYTDWLSKQTGQGYRLPTEAEWEYAARGGTATSRYWGEGEDSKACLYASVADKAHSWTASFPCDDGYEWVAPVGRFEPNAYGLYDMLGNVWEWTCSAYEADYDGSEARCISKNDASAYRVDRGGSWGNRPRFVRAANRYRFTPDYRYYNLGFRLARPL